MTLPLILAVAFGGIVARWRLFVRYGTGELQEWEFDIAVKGDDGPRSLQL